MLQSCVKKRGERQRENVKTHAFSALSAQPGRARYLSDSCLLCRMDCCASTCQWYRLTCSYRPHFISARYRFDFDGGTFHVSLCVYTRVATSCALPFAATTPPPQTPLRNYAVCCVTERYTCAVVSLRQERDSTARWARSFRKRRESIISEKQNY